ncbi:hypothetical protein [Vreelandella sp. EE22]
MYIRFFICFFLSILVGWITFGDLESFTGESFLNVMGVLLNVSSIVFAIIGAWIAIIYPRVLQSSISSNRIESIEVIDESVKNADYLSELFQIVLQSAFVIVVAVAIQVVFPLLKSYQYFDLDMSYVRSVAVSIMIFLALAQINAISVVVEKNFSLLLRVRKKNRENIIDNDS